MRKLLIVALVALSLVLVACKQESITGGTVLEGDVELCKDSDGGLDDGEQGVVAFEDEDYADNCVAGLLIEYYCDGDNLANQNVRCPNKCVSGRCT